MLKNRDNQTTLAGAVLAALTAATIDPEKLAAGDRAELVKIGMTLAFAILGWASNKQ